MGQIIYVLFKGVRKLNIAELQNKLVNSISKLIDGKIKETTKTATVVKPAVITSVNDNNCYGIKINGYDYVARSNFSHSAGNVVWVIIANGNYQNIFILYDQSIRK